MTLSASSNFDVADQAPLTAEAAVIVQPPVGVGTGGKGRLVHATLGTYDYLHAPTSTVNVDGDVCVPPVLAHAATLGGGVSTEWPGFLPDVQVTEIWEEGDVGCEISHLRALWSFFVNRPAAGEDVLWSPSYANGHTYRVRIEAVRAGGEGYGIDWMLTKAVGPYAPQPVELVLRVLGYADEV